MNLLILKAKDISNNVAHVTGRQLEHVFDIHNAKKGDIIKVGLLNGPMGSGKILTIDNNKMSLALNLDLSPPKPLPLTMILALPRPKMLRRILQTISAMGVKELYLVNSSRVEKSYWQSPFLSPKSIEEQLLLGLEQAKDTTLPNVHLRKLFKPFVEDELLTIAKDSLALVAHPSTDNRCPVDCDVSVTLAIGPEGGFIPYEIDLLKKQNFKATHVGERILRVENAIPAIISRLFPG
ncbi:MAG: 16S rRNA (uracil(1498)-N(3))-methyltransferase [Porticoccaceae bacterium]|nr:16S rRNA (uracil(1498)-N(3))-methyltransferase [Porticoccaceae bacterium]|tara:strand:+ start:415 stop:1125 length:711 start_codon:yes stop_codon:yes gene_type:complete